MAQTAVRDPAVDRGATPDRRPVSDLSGSDRRPVDSLQPMTEDTFDRQTLHAPLPGLVAADDPAAYAAEHGLAVEDGAVVVVIRLADDGDLPAEYVRERKFRQGATVGATVPVDALEPLADHPGVRAIRSSESPVEGDAV